MQRFKYYLVFSFLLLLTACYEYEDFRSVNIKVNGRVVNSSGIALQGGPVPNVCLHVSFERKKVNICIDKDIDGNPIKTDNNGEFIVIIQKTQHTTSQSDWFGKFQKLTTSLEYNDVDYPGEIDSNDISYNGQIKHVEGEISAVYKIDSYLTEVNDSPREKKKESDVQNESPSGIKASQE